MVVAEKQISKDQTQDVESMSYPALMTTRHLLYGKIGWNGRILTENIFTENPSAEVIKRIIDARDELGIILTQIPEVEQQISEKGLIPKWIIQATSERIYNSSIKLPTIQRIIDYIKVLPPDANNQEFSIKVDHDLLLELFITAGFLNFRSKRKAH